MHPRMLRQQVFFLSSCDSENSYICQATSCFVFPPLASCHFMSFHAIMPCLQELLVATRHVLATDFKRAFFPHLDALLDDRWEAVRGRD